MIFDLDGILPDTPGAVADMSNQVLVRLNFPQHQKNPRRYFVGYGRKSVMQKMVPATLGIGCDHRGGLSITPDPGVVLEMAPPREGFATSRNYQQQNLITSIITQWS